ncbi:MAG: class I SAM-dependent methyltransferase [Treponema sp.]|nr:class I SAM-dependent methyltransferase [Treponema sp.]
MSSPAALLVPACEEGRGGGHLSRCLFLLQALEERGLETYLWLAEAQKESVFLRFRDFFERSSFSKGFHARLLSRESELSVRQWEFIILDRYKTPPQEFAFWRGLGPLIGIDEGGPRRSRFDFLVDLLPALEGPESNVSAPGLLPLPRNRRPPGASPSSPLRVLVSFGAEDAAGLGFLAAKSLAKNRRASPPPEVTFVAPVRDYAAGKKPRLSGVTVTGTQAGLKEQLAHYDLFITHFGIGAFEAVYARLPVLLVSPSGYHEKLSRNAGFLSLGIGPPAARRLENLSFSGKFLAALSSRGARIARRFGLEGDQREDLGSFLGSLAPCAPAFCPVCGERTAPAPVLARFPEETYHRCKHCRAIYLSRLTPPPVQYEKDYFFGAYKKQYGKTYLEDFPNLVEMGRRRLSRIQRLPHFRRLREIGSETRPRVFDIGCAYGPFLAAAAERGFSPCGVDPVQDAVRHVTEELGFPAWQGFFPTGAKAEDGPFDAVTMWYVLEHFPQPEKILREIHRILKDGGALAFSTPSFSGVSGRKHLRSFLKASPPDHFTVWSPGICKRVLKRCGFSLRGIVVTGHHPQRFPLFGRFLRPGEKGALYRTLLLASRLFRLGDTFEVYAVKVKVKVKAR